MNAHFAPSPQRAIARSGGDGVQHDVAPGRDRPRRRAAAQAGMPTGFTCDEPPPEITPTSAWPPITAMRFSAARDRQQSPRSFRSTTIACSARRCAPRLRARRSRSAVCAGVVEQAHGEHRAQHAADHVRDARFAGSRRSATAALQRLVEEHLLVELLAGLLVEALDRVVELVHRAPVATSPSRDISNRP